MSKTPTQRGVRIMCDFFADGVWNLTDVPHSMDGFRVSNELWARIQAWQEWHDSQDVSLEPDPNFDVEGFTIEGLMIARAVKEELPNWTVIYSDEAVWDVTNERRPRPSCSYEISLKPH